MGTIDDLVSLSDHTWQRLRDRMAGLMDAVPMPRVPRGARPLRGRCLSLVLHILDELIHHGAEAALLRDLYGHRG